MQDRRILFGVVASAALALAGHAVAQTDGEGAPPTAPELSPIPDRAPAPEARPEADPAPAPKADGDDSGAPPLTDAAIDDSVPDTAEARREHMESLFTLLADKDNKDWDRTAQQIQVLWNRSGSDSMDLLLFRSREAMEKKDYDTAILHLNDLVRLAPDFAEGWNLRATVFFIKEEYGRSLEDIAKALKLEPRHYGAMSGLGIILDRIGEKKAALEVYRRAQAIHPHLDGVNEGIKNLTKDVEGQRL